MTQAEIDALAKAKLAKKEQDNRVAEVIYVNGRGVSVGVVVNSADHKAKQKDPAWQTAKSRAATAKKKKDK